MSANPFLSLYLKSSEPGDRISQGLELEKLWRRLSKEEKEEFLLAGITPYLLILQGCHFGLEVWRQRERRKRIERRMLAF